MHARSYETRIPFRHELHDDYGPHICHDQRVYVHSERSHGRRGSACASLQCFMYLSTQIQPHSQHSKFTIRRKIGPIPSLAGGHCSSAFQKSYCNTLYASNALLACATRSACYRFIGTSVKRLCKRDREANTYSTQSPWSVKVPEHALN